MRMLSTISRPSVPQLPTALYSSFIVAADGAYNLRRPGSNADPVDGREPAGDQILQRGAEGGHGAGAVGGPVLLLVGELGHGEAGAGHDEERIVPEPAAAPRRPADRSFAAALGHDLARLALAP